ncbi:UPF0481 protein At3g47200-like [Pistacia vera]|uniref:UPF0481 protein At3g47200-like n=1 Tax=Pistacia vera TaxID=55513 RepID=UPI001263443A|nr:UPF0481 protein At3g47200-like [Pistacia vera]
MEMSSSLNEDRPRTWLIDTKEDQEPDPSKCCIYRVPESIRKGNAEAYTPKMFSIGPFHNGKDKIKDMEEKKWRYVKDLCDRTTPEKFDEIFNFIKDQEQTIRKSYSEDCKLESRAYVKMILRDAIFIIEVLIKDFERDGSDILLRIPAQRYALKSDLLLMENQLPYFLLEGLYELVASRPSFIDICIKFFRFRKFAGSVRDKKKFKHFTDLQRAILVEKFPAHEIDHEDDDVYIPCATKLHESGVKFKLAPRRECPLVIRFEEGELTIPELIVNHETDTKFRNIMALEQCCYPNRTIVCDYVLLLGSLIEDKRDAQLLVDKEIIWNEMGDSKALANLFNKIAIEIPLAGNHYNKIYQDLRAYHDDPYNQNCAKLKRMYFSDIWRGTATVAAAVLLILTFIQTMSSVMR